MTGKLSIFCPAMPILATWVPWVRECQELPSTWKIEWDDGKIIEGQITFPKAKVRFQWWPGQWLVDQVPAAGPNIAVTMEPERVCRDDWRTMVAQPCLGRGTYIDSESRIWRIVPKVDANGVESFFPACRATAVGLGLLKYIAEPVTAEGLVVPY